MSLHGLPMEFPEVATISSTLCRKDDVGFCAWGREFCSMDCAGVASGIVLTVSICIEAIARYS